jgi:hypothetical protein
MANYKAISAVGKAIEAILTNTWKKESPGNGVSKATFCLVRATDFTGNDQKAYDPGATVYLYRIGRNASYRSQILRREEGKSYRSSLALDLYFLITPWAATAEAQLYLLGWIMRTLEGFNPTSAVSLNQSYEGTFLSKESVELIFDPLSLTDMAILWENLKTEKILPSITYVVRGVIIDSDLEMSSAKPVQTREMK